jgi:O-antigen ligase
VTEAVAVRSPAWPRRARDAFSDGLVVGLLLVVIYVVLRAAHAPEPAVLAWTAVAAGLALVSPIGGLTVLGALGPFTEAQADNGLPTAIPFLLAAIGASLLISLARTRAWPKPDLALALVATLFVGTLLGVANTFVSFGSQRGISAVEGWIPGIGGGLTVLLVAAYVAWRGDRRAIFVTVGSICLAAVLSLTDFFAGGVLHAGPLAWLLRSYGRFRLSGVIPAPNASATIFMVGAVVCVGVALFAHRRDWRISAAVLAVPCIVAVVVTFSRSGLVALALAGAVFAWHWRRRVGAAALVAVAALAVAVVVLGFVRPIADGSDQARLDAWAAAIRMWAAHPLLGQGFRSFEWLHADYGSVVLDAPHNEWLRFFAEEGTVIGAAGIAFAMALPAIVIRAGGVIAVSAAAVAAGFALMAAFNNPFLYAQVTVPTFMVIGTGLGLALARLPDAMAPRAVPQ